jgi:hypothetical protein
MLFLDGSKHTIAEIPHRSVVPFAVTVVFTVLPYPAGLWNDSFSAASTSAAVIPILSASMKSCVDCKNTDRLSLSAFKQAAVAARAKAEKEHAMMAFIQLDAGQSGCGATYRLTLGLSVPWLASMVALLRRLI